MSPVPDVLSAQGIRSSRPLRAWQRDALEAYFADRPEDFLVTATPGSGKTKIGRAHV